MPTVSDAVRCARKVADDAWYIAAGSAIIDGEIVVPAADGTTDFSVLQNELKGQSAKSWSPSIFSISTAMIFESCRIYAGKVDHGFDKKSSVLFRALLDLKQLDPLGGNEADPSGKIGTKAISET